MYTICIGEDSSKILTKLVDQNTQIIGLLSDFVKSQAVQSQQPAAPIVQQPAAPIIQQPAAPIIQQPAAPIVQQPAAPIVQQPAAPIVQQPVAPIIAQQPVDVRSKTPTLLELLDTTDEELDFLNSPSWLSSEELSTPSQPFQPLQPFPPAHMKSSSSYTYQPRFPEGQSSSQSPHPSFYMPPPPFSTPPKLLPTDEVMRHYPGESIETLRKMATALAMQSIFGRDALRRSSLRGGGKNNTDSLDKEKLDYIKSAVQSRVPNIPSVAFEAIWDKCRYGIGKRCQTLRDSAATAKKKEYG